VTTRPELDLGPHLLPGVVAVALFALLAGAFLATPMGAQAGFPGTTVNETNVTAALADGGSVVGGDATYETDFDGQRTQVTVTLADDSTVTRNLTTAAVGPRRVGATTHAAVTVEAGGDRLTLASVPLVDHDAAGAGPGAQVGAVNRSATAGGDAGLYAVARRGSITENVGYTMFDLRSIQPLPGESFLIAFEIVDLVLVAALVGAVMLARREPGDELTTALGTEDDDSETDGQGGED
jgi:hypothetical protein